MGLPTEQHRSIDVTGLPEEAIRTVELLVSQLRVRTRQERLGGAIPFASRYEGAEAIAEGAASHKPRDMAADYDEEGIYPYRV